ncbi:hypothetical protein Slin14017_G106380 [Septoria linicola]|nr:hypothetical protein Slin14017_G106380 [Septoria linicola]
MSERQHSVPAGDGPPDHRVAELVRDWINLITVERRLLPNLLDAFTKSLPDEQTVLKSRAIRAHLLSGDEDEQHTVGDGKLIEILRGLSAQTWSNSGIERADSWNLGLAIDSNDDIGCYRAGGGVHLPRPSILKLPGISLLRDGGRIGMWTMSSRAALAIRALQFEADRAAHAGPGAETHRGIVWKRP